MPSLPAPAPPRTPPPSCRTVPRPTSAKAADPLSNTDAVSRCAIPAGYCFFHIKETLRLSPCFLKKSSVILVSQHQRKEGSPYEKAASSALPFSKSLPVLRFSDRLHRVSHRQRPFCFAAGAGLRTGYRSGRISRPLHRCHCCRDFRTVYLRTATDIFPAFHFAKSHPDLPG